MDPEMAELFSGEELTRIYREAAAEAADDGGRLRVLLAPYCAPAVPKPRHGDNDET